MKKKYKEKTLYSKYFNCYIYIYYKHFCHCNSKHPVGSLAFPETMQEEGNQGSLHKIRIYFLLLSLCTVPLRPKETVHAPMPFPHKRL